MSPIDALGSALQSLRANMLRSILTMLGIIIGVASVVVMIAIGSGAEYTVRNIIQGLGSNIITISPGSRPMHGVSTGAGSRANLTLADAWSIQDEVDHIEIVAASVQGDVQLIAGHLNWRSRVTGATPGVFQAREWIVEEGRYLTDADLRGGVKAAVIGQTVAENLFPGQNPVGRTMRINRVPFRVVGLLVEKGQTTFGRDQDDTVIVPLTTAKQRILGHNRSSADSVRTITVKVSGAEWMSKAEQDVREVLRLRHRLSIDDDDDFRLRNLAQILETSVETTRVMTLLLSAVASVSLLVGGIGVMNIMLVSVTERTREIGLRMAVGARQRDIQIQFLIEAVVLSLIGGLVGILLGLILSEMVANIAGWPIVVPITAIFLAFGSAAAIGVGFGFFPALRAARLNPIEALRHE